MRVLWQYACISIQECLHVGYVQHFYDNLLTFDFMTFSWSGDSVRTTSTWCRSMPFSMTWKVLKWPAMFIFDSFKEERWYLSYSRLHSIQFVTCNAKMREGLVIFVLCILGNDILYVRWTLWDQTHPEVLCDVLKKCCLSSHATEQTSNSSWRTAFRFCYRSRHPLRISFSIASDECWVAGLHGYYIGYLCSS